MGVWLIGASRSAAGPRPRASAGGGRGRREPTAAGQGGEPSRNGGSAGGRGRARAEARLLAVGLALVVAACGGDEEGPAEPGPDLDRLAATARGERGTPAGVEAAEAWAEAARAASRPDQLRQARRLLELAAEQVPAIGCAAELALARLDRPEDPARAYRHAYRARRLEGDAACHDAAGDLLGALAEHRPPAGELVQLDRALGLAVEVEPCRLTRLASYGAGPNGVRVALYLEGACAYEERRDGDAFVLAFPTLARDPELAAEQALPGGGVGRVTLGEGEDAELRFALEPGATARAFFLRAPDRVLVDVSAQALLAERTEQRESVIVLDPGHGGNEFGARYDGLKESEIVLDLTRRVARILTGRLPRARVLLTRHRDEVVSLEQRTAMANAAGADVFVSIHLNAADEPVETGGITTFVLDETDDRQALRLAARENGTAVADVTGIQRLLARVHRRDQVAHSRALAEAVHRHTLEGGRRVLPQLPDRGVRSALFYVLVGARMPAVLLEASFLTKPEEAAALRTERYRRALAAGIAEGIVHYVADGEQGP